MSTHTDRETFTPLSALRPAQCPTEPRSPSSSTLASWRGVGGPAEGQPRVLCTQYGPRPPGSSGFESRDPSLGGLTLFPGAPPSVMVHGQCLHVSPAGPGSVGPRCGARIRLGRAAAPRLAGPDPGPTRPARPRSGTHASGPGDGGARGQGGSSPPLTPLQPRRRRCASVPSASPSSSSGAGKVTLAGSRHFLTLVDIAAELLAARSQQPGHPGSSTGAAAPGTPGPSATCSGARGPRPRCRLCAVCRPDSIAARRRGFPARRGRRGEGGGMGGGETSPSQTALRRNQTDQQVGS